MSSPPQTVSVVSLQSARMYRIRALAQVAAGNAEVLFRVCFDSPFPVHSANGRRKEIRNTSGLSESLIIPARY